MRGKQILFFSLLVIAVVAIAGIPTKSQLYEINANGDPDLIAGRNVNMVSGTILPDGDPYLQRQNEPSIAVSTRNPLHLLAGANDYRTVDIPFSEGELPGQMQNQATGDAWLGVFKSLDGGESWTSTLLDGYPQQNNSSSPLDGYEAAADPVVRAGTNGLFFYSGIVFNRSEPINSAVFVARFIDNNNDEEGDPIQRIDTTIIDALEGGRFKDKPWIAVDIPENKAKNITIDGQKIPKSNVYIVYSVFKEVEGEQQSEILFCRSTDCGNTWEEPIILSTGHNLNQGATIAVDPRGNGHVFVAWRRFTSGAGQSAQSNAIVLARSTNEGKEFPDVVEVTELPGPFDQPTTDHVTSPLGTSFRTNSYPSMTIDHKGRIYIAWAQRGMDPAFLNDSRVLIATSKDGFVWTTPMTIETSILAAINSECYQFMPSITFAGSRLILAWYDTRYDYCDDYIPPDYISDSGNIRHTIDVRVAQGMTGEFPVFQPSVQVSRYLWAMWESSPGNYYFSQVQFNPPNYPLFKGGIVPFHGDYIDIAPSPPLVLTPNGKWRFNTKPTDSQQFHLAWTDNRDVRPPDDGLWTAYNPPESSQSFSQSQFLIQTPCTVAENTGMRNQNIYTSLITSVMEAGSPGNNKPLGTLGTNPATGELIPRAFVIFVKNPTEDIRHYRMEITEGPAHGTASFLEFDILEEIDVSIAPFSSISRPLFVTSSDENDTVTVEVFEIDELGGSPIAGGASSTIIINPDKTNPDVTGDLANTETHDPDISSPNIVNWTLVNPNIVNPNIVNPNIVNPNIVNPNIVNPNIVNPNIVNPNIVNPSITNPNIVNP
ncbi:MAG: exo-alpha-sialidase, partial [Candidatus Aminicenantes bacterium]